MLTKTGLNQASNVNLLNEEMHHVHVTVYVYPVIKNVYYTILLPDSGVPECRKENVVNYP